MTKNKKLIVGFFMVSAVLGVTVITGFHFLKKAEATHSGCGNPNLSVTVPGVNSTFPKTGDFINPTSQVTGTNVCQGNFTQYSSIIGTEGFFTDFRSTPFSWFTCSSAFIDGIQAAKRGSATFRTTITQASGVCNHTSTRDTTVLIKNYPASFSTSLVNPPPSNQYAQGAPVTIQFNFGDKDNPATEVTSFGIRVRKQGGAFEAVQRSGTGSNLTVTGSLLSNYTGIATTTAYFFETGTYEAYTKVTYCTSNSGCTTATSDTGLVTFEILPSQYVAGPQAWKSDTVDAGAGNTYEPATFNASWALDGTNNIVPTFSVLGSATCSFTGEETSYAVLGAVNGADTPITTTPARCWKARGVIDTGADRSDTPKILDLALREADPNPPLVLQANGEKVGIGILNPISQLDINGAFKIGDEGARPTCVASERGTIWADLGGGLVKDSLTICLKDASDLYGWRTIY